MKRFLAGFLACIVAIVLASISFGATEIRLLGDRDLSWGSGTWVSTGGRTVYRINADIIPFSQDNAVKVGSLYPLASAGNWKVIYTDGTGTIIPQALPASGLCWKSAGVTNPPEWGTCGTGGAGEGDMLKSVYDTNANNIVDYATTAYSISGQTFGTMASQNYYNVSITGGTLSGVTITSSTMAAKQNADADLTTLSALGTWKIPYSDDTSTIQALAVGAAGTVLCFNGVSAAPTSCSPTFSAPGSDTQVIFNDGGVPGADAGMVYDKTLNNLTIDNTVTAAKYATTALDNTWYINIGNTANPSLADGACAYDKTDETLECGDGSTNNVIGGKVHRWEGTYALLTPADADDIIVDYARKAITLTAVACIANGTTPSASIDLQECDQDGASNCASVLSGAITCNGGYDTGSISDSAIAVDHTLKLIVNGAPTGTVTGVTLFVTGTQSW